MKNLSLKEIAGIIPIIETNENEEKVSTKMVIFSHLSDIQEKHPDTRKEINFIKSLFLLYEKGKRNITSSELNKEWIRFNK